MTRTWIWVGLVVIVCVVVFIIVWQQELRSASLSHQLTTAQGIPRDLAVIVGVLHLRETTGKLGTITENNLSDTLGLDVADGVECSNMAELLPIPFTEDLDLPRQWSFKRIRFEFPPVKRPLALHLDITAAGHGLLLDFDKDTGKLVGWHTRPTYPNMREMVY